MGKQFFLWLVPSSRYLSSRRLVRLDVWRGTGGRLVDPQFHICALADLWEYSPVYCECDMTVIQIQTERDEGCLTPDVSRRGEREILRCWKRNLVSGLEGAADLICWSPPRTPGGHGAAEVSTLDVLLTPTTDHRWSPNPKLETNVWWFSLASE